MKAQIQTLLVVALILSSTLLSAAEKYFVYGVNGNIEVEVIQYDQNNHKVIKYHENGTIQEQGYYKDSLKNGCWMSFDVEGNCTSRVYFDMGNRTGLWNIQSFNGDYYYRVAYEDDKAITVRKIAATGEVLEAFNP